MVTQEQRLKYKKYIKSKEWYELKIDLLQARGCKCEKCNRELQANKLQVHHVTYERLFNERLSDLLVLCGRCHQIEHGIIKRKKYAKTKDKAKKNVCKLSTIDKIKKEHEKTASNLRQKLKQGLITKKVFFRAIKGNNTRYMNNLKKYKLIKQGLIKNG